MTNTLGCKYSTLSVGLCSKRLVVRQLIMISTLAKISLLLGGFLLLAITGSLASNNQAVDHISNSDISSQQLEQQQPQLHTPSSHHHSISALSSPASGSSQLAASSAGKSRSPRSIGDMFKKFFNGNKRSKSSQSARDYDQQQQQQQQLQQQQQQQQFQQFQQQQNQIAAVNLAAAAANQHAVYASPFATYSTSAGAPYPQFTPTYSVAWPQAALRGAPTLLAAAAGPAGSPLAATPLYAAASQSYSSFAAPPPPPPPPALTSSVVGASAGSSASNPSAAASHQHASAVPAPPGMQPSGSAGSSSLDFHQVLDALVRTSGFAPAGDPQEAASAAYGSGKPEGTPVFSFKKLVSLPFYLSSEEKSLEGLANAGMGHAGPGAYSLHSMPIMRRHVRRMSASPSQQQQQLSQHLANLQAGDSSQRSEREQQQRYTNYFNALNNQLASMTANNQLMQYLTRQQNQPSIASQVEAYTAEAALASYQQAMNGNYKRPQQSVSPASGGFSAAASMLTPMAVQAPHQYQQQQQQPGTIKQQQQQQQQQFANEQERELQNLLASMQQQLSFNLDPYSSSAGAAASYQQPSYSNQQLDGTHRYGAQQQYYSHPSSSNYYWPNSVAMTGAIQNADINSNNNNNNGNVLLNSNGEQLSLAGSSASASPLSTGSSSSLANSQQQLQSAAQASSTINAQNNAMDHQQLNHLAQQQQQQQQQSQASGQSAQQAAAGANAASASTLIDGSIGQQQQQSALGTQQVSNSGSSNNFHSQASLIAEQNQ